MSTKDLMARMGHDDMRAADLPAGHERCRSAHADRLSALVDEHRGRRPASEGDEEASLVAVMLLRALLTMRTTKAQLRCGHRVSWAFG